MQRMTHRGRLLWGCNERVLAEERNVLLLLCPPPETQLVPPSPGAEQSGPDASLRAVNEALCARMRESCTGLGDISLAHGAVPTLRPFRKIFGPLRWSPS